LSICEKLKNLLEKNGIFGLCSIERGGALSRLHLQMVCRIIASSMAIVTKQIKNYFQWNKVETTPVGHHILTKTFHNSGLHTFIGMLGYCFKDKGQDHFECVDKNVTPE